MLTDTGPLVALLDSNDHQHITCVNVMQKFSPSPLWTTWACLTEAMYLLDSLGGYRYQERLWRLRRDDRLVLLDITTAEADRMAMLMNQYQNVPMDLADASLIAVAENRNFLRLFTLDSDFYIYRLADGSVLDVTP
jgi:predicted nucleic acid-binding protein